MYAAIYFLDKYCFLIGGRSWGAFQGTCCICPKADQPYKSMLFFCNEIVVTLSCSLACRAVTQSICADRVRYLFLLTRLKVVHWGISLCEHPMIPTMGVLSNYKEHLNCITFFRPRIYIFVYGIYLVIVHQLLHRSEHFFFLTTPLYSHADTLIIFSMWILKHQWPTKIHRMPSGTWRCGSYGFH